LEPDPNDGRKKLVPTWALSPEARKTFYAEQTTEPLEKANAVLAPQNVGAPQISFKFTDPSSRQQKLLAGAPPAVPKHHEQLIRQVSGFVGATADGNYRRYLGHEIAGILVKNKSTHLKACCREYGISPSKGYELLRSYREVKKDPAIPDDRKDSEFWSRVFPKPRPGRSAHTFFNRPGNAWMLPIALSLFQTQAKRSMPETLRLLHLTVDCRQRAAGIEEVYEKPTLAQLRTALRKIDRPMLILAREGEKPYEDQFGSYISRRPPDYSGDYVSTDQKLLDIICRDHSWNLGRIWMVNFVDVASSYWLGGAFGPVLSGDMVMDAAAMMLERCTPRNVQMDLGGEFIGKRFLGGTFKITRERVYEEAIGLWERLGVNPVKAIGENPKTKPIERWHRCVRDFEQLWPTWCGSNPKERPEQLSEIEREVKVKIDLFKRGQGDPPPVPTVEEVIRAFMFWAENVWNAGARGRGRYRGNLTPLEAWNVKRPPGGHRALRPDQIEYYTADHRFTKISRGGQINLWFHGQKVEYEAAELFRLQGLDTKVEVIISRRDLSQVTVIYPVAGGTASCVAKWKGESTWGEESRETVKLRMRCIATVKRALKRGIEATHNAAELLGAASYLPTAELLAQASKDKLIDRRQAFGVPSPQLTDPTDHPSIGRTKYTMERLHRRNKTASAIADRWLPRRPTSEEAANEVWQLMQHQAKGE
jgi:hypothetical protein